MTDPQPALRPKSGLPPIARGDARLFILGSLPGDASLAARRYYAHPRNQFWRLVGGAIGEDLQSLDYQARIDRLADRRIGLWDVVGEAVRTGSLDQAIRSARHNAIDRLTAEFPDLVAIAFNGSAAAAIGRRQIAGHSGLRLLDLPSSSPANTRPFADKAEAWNEIGHILAGPGLRRGAMDPRVSP